MACRTDLRHNVIADFDHGPSRSRLILEDDATFGKRIDNSGRRYFRAIPKDVQYGARQRRANMKFGASVQVLQAKR